MLKSKLRKQIIKIREKKNKNNIKINFTKILDILKAKKIGKKNIGGYFPVNYEVDDLELLKEFEKKNFCHFHFFRKKSVKKVLKSKAAKENLLTPARYVISVQITRFFSSLVRLLSVK